MLSPVHTSNNVEAIGNFIEAPSTPATMSKQHIVERYKFNDSFDNVECCFDTVVVFGNNVAGFGNNVERNFVLSTMSKQTEHVQFVSTLSKGRNFTTESFDIVAVGGNKVECCFDKVERCFDIVASVDRALDVAVARAFSDVTYFRYDVSHPAASSAVVCRRRSVDITHCSLTSQSPPTVAANCASGTYFHQIFTI